MFEEKMTRLMAALGVKTDSELARALGITPPSVASARAKSQVPIGWIEKISLMSNTSMDWLYFGRGPMHPGEPTVNQPIMPQPTVAPPPESAPSADCPHCARLEAKLEKLESKLEGVEAQRDDLVLENRQLWKENGEYRERLARYEERAIKPDMEEPDPDDRPLA